MTRIKALIKYWDKQLNKDINIGEEYEVEDDRADVIANAGYAKKIVSKFVDVKEEEIKPVEEQEEIKEAPKKKAKKASK